MAIVTLDSIHKTYPLGKLEVEAVKGVSFSIEKGEFAAISGPSGSGKSTILNMIGLIDLPTTGTLVIDGIDVYGGVNLSSINAAAGQRSKFTGDGSGKKPNKKNSVSTKLDNRITELRRTHLGFIFQNFNLIPVLNVFENVEFPLLLGNKGKKSDSPVDSMTKSQRDEWIHYLIEKVGLTDWEKHKPGELSGGQRQRTAIARALVTKAPVILADEPTANLDSENSAQILALMKNLNKEMNTTFIFSTHDSRIVDMCDHVVYLLDGKIINDVHKEGRDDYARPNSAGTAGGAN